MREGGEGLDNVGLGRARPPRWARRVKRLLSVSLMLSRPGHAIGYCTMAAGL